MHRDRANDRRPRRFLPGVVALLVVCGAVPLTSRAGAEPPAPRPEAALALAWIEEELTAGGDGMPGFSPGSYDWGLTADAVLALAAGGRGDSPAAVATTENLLDNVTSFATWDDFGGDVPGVRVAGALGKLHLAAQAQGITDPAQTDGFDLEAEVRATMQTAGDQAGRFSDINPHFPSDASNGFGQTLAMMGLAYTDEGIPALAVQFLLAQQCPDGGFRLNYSGTPGCTTSTASDSDTTAMAVQALLVADRTPAVSQSLLVAADWLAERQDPSGGWGGTGPTANLNSNSTGLIAQALLAGGRDAAASSGATWIADVTLTDDVVAETPLADEVGAIAYTPAARDGALSAGIDANQRDQWRRATTQAVLGLGLPSYGAIGRAVPQPIDPPVQTLTPAEAFVTAAYVDFLDREPTSSELATGASRAGTTPTSRAAVVRDLASSDEWIGAIVVRFYQDTLGRNPDPSGLRFWTDQLRSGSRSVARTAGEFYASDEYFRNRGGGTVTSWVTDLYGRLLGRGPDGAGLAYWTGRTAALGRQSVAYQLYQSPESRRDRVRGLYGQLLGRGPDAGGLAFWSDRILTEGDLALATSLASSNEYANRAILRFP